MRCKITVFCFTVLLFYPNELFSSENVWRFKLFPYLCTRKSPPSLSLMLKCAGRFILYIQIWPNDILQNLILLHRSWCNFFVPEGWKSAMSRKPSSIWKASVTTDCPLTCIRSWNLPSMNIYTNKEHLSCKWWCCIGSTRNCVCFFWIY